MAQKTNWIVVDIPLEQIIKLKQEQPWVLVNLFKGLQDEKVIDRKTLGVNGITTIFSKKLLAKEQKKPQTHMTFVFPSTFTFKVKHTKFNENTRIYEDVIDYPVSGLELQLLLS